MKKNKKVILYSNEFDSERYEAARQFLLEENGEEPTDNEIFEEFYIEDDMNWDDFKSEYKEYFNTNYFVVRANLGRWNERFESSEIMTDGWKDFLRVIEDYDNLEIVDNNGHLEIIGKHHDGTDYLEIRELTHKGYVYVNIYNYGKSESELAQAVWNNFHSRLPRLAARA